LYQPRLYREEMKSDRFRFFSSVHRESDLLIGVPPGEFHQDMQEISLKEQVRLYNLLMTYIQDHPGFSSSLEPLNLPAGCPDPEPEITNMLQCGVRTGTGPMSSVAGIFAESVGNRLSETHALQELLVENGGDVYIMNRSSLVTVIHAGNSKLSGKIGLVIPSGEWGVCTSSGTLGHSYSMGNADAVTVVSKSTPMADAWATALANQVRHPDDIELLLDRVAGIPEIVSCVVIAGERMGIRGDFETKLLS
jgi:ApbE superfamily uncharacterized protein (UPF0280 family)